jgi:hypothetical protein
MAAWKTPEHLTDHYGWHRGELRVRSVAEYDASAQETLLLGTPFTYRDPVTGEPRIGYFHRATSRFVSTDLDGYVRTHFQTDESHVAGLPLSTYRD